MHGLWHDDVGHGVLEAPSFLVIREGKGAAREIDPPSEQDGPSYFSEFKGRVRGHSLVREYPKNFFKLLAKQILQCKIIMFSL